jgi:hypothetical protein
MRFPLALVPFLAALAHVALSACTVDLPQDPAQAPLPSFATPAPAVVVIAPQAVEPCAPPPVGGVGVVRSEGFVDVDITVGAADSVRLACDPALASAVHVEAVGEALRIWNDDAASGGGHCAVHLGLGSLRALDVSGSGDARVHGRAEGLARVAASGSGDVVIDDLDADTAHLSTSGSADIAVRHARPVARGRDLGIGRRARRGRERDRPHLGLRQRRRRRAEPRRGGRRRGGLRDGRRRRPRLAPRARGRERDRRRARGRAAPRPIRVAERDGIDRVRVSLRATRARG